MKQRRHALRGRAAFSRVFAAGRRIEGSLVRCLVILEPASDPVLNVGYAVSSRGYTAVRRNRLRRLMREGFRLHQENLRKALVQRSMSAFVVFAFKPQAESAARRLKGGPVFAEMGTLCTRLQEML